MLKLVWPTESAKIYENKTQKKSITTSVKKKKKKKRCVGILLSGESLTDMSQRLYCYFSVELRSKDNKSGREATQ